MAGNVLKRAWATALAKRLRINTLDKLSPCQKQGFGTRLCGRVEKGVSEKQKMHKSKGRGMEKGMTKGKGERN